MGYTNKTSHYELPQYVANDKPSWLGDFNAAMLKIDTVMADNDATAEAANSAATGAQTQVASLASQITTLQGQVNTAVDTATAADGKATTAQTVAGQANTTASEAKTQAEIAKTAADTATETANAALPKSGGVMTGALTLSGAPTTDNQAATKAYVDEKAGAGSSINVGGDYNFNSPTLVNKNTTVLSVPVAGNLSDIVVEYEICGGAIGAANIGLVNITIGGTSTSINNGAQIDAAVGAAYNVRRGTISFKGTNKAHIQYTNTGLTVSVGAFTDGAAGSINVVAANNAYIPSIILNVYNVA